MQSPKSSQGPAFSADRPIPNRAADRLSRSRFADSIAKAVEGWRGKDSLVIALYGRWGMGKTSIKNMVLDALQSAHPQKVEVAEFNPWAVVNREQLTELFFDELSRALKKGPSPNRENRRRLVNRLRRYAIRLKAGAGISAAILKALTWLLVALGAMAIAIPFTGPTTVIVVGMLLIATATGLHFSSSVAQLIGDYLSAPVGPSQKSLTELKDELVNELASLPRPLLVVLDDADRLTPSELQLLVQLVKINADFPNVVYLLIVDRAVAAQHLSKVLSVDGDEYLDKIVQVPFDIPVLGRLQLQKLLFEDLNKLLGEFGQQLQFDEARWANLFVNSLQHFFENLRQTNRFLSTFAFHLSMSQADGCLEVNPVDLIAIEALRIFEPGTYRAVALNKEVLTSVKKLTFANESERSEAVKVIFDSASAARKENVSELLKQLFPLIEVPAGRYSTVATDRWQRELRVCSEEIFDRYFQFAILEGDVPQSRIDLLLRSSGNRDALRESFLSLNTDHLLEIAIDRLDAYKEVIPTEHALPFVTALFDIGDLLSENTPGMFELSPAMHGSRIIHWYLKLLPSPEERADILKQAIQDTTGLSLVIHFLMIQQQAAEKADSSEPIFLTASALDELRKLGVRKIRGAANAKTLAYNPNLIYILYRWKNWGDSEEVKDWCARLLEEQGGLLIILRAFTRRAVSVSSGDYVEKESWYIKLGDLEQFVSLTEIDERLKRISLQEMNLEERRAVTAYNEAIARRAAGKKDFGEELFDG